jgi:hypothetical protein
MNKSDEFLYNEMEFLYGIIISRFEQLIKIF